MPKLASFRVVYCYRTNFIYKLEAISGSNIFFLAECALTNYVFFFSPRADSGYGLNDIHEKILN